MVPIFWFLGLSASGKSTFSEYCFEFLNENKHLYPNIEKWQLLDGDEIRKFLGKEFGYGFEDRRKSVRSVGLTARMLSKSGIGVVVANISPFHDLRTFFRENLEGYNEIYCKCSIEECVIRDPKGFYKKQIKNGIKDYVGLDIPFQEPSDPDLVINTEIEPIELCYKMVENFIVNDSEGKTFKN